MGRAVNRLGERIIELLALEREQAADLSHRLRTPLAALALEADTLHDEADRQRIRSAVRELTEEVNRVIVQVRQVRPVRMPEICDATATVRERLAFWSVLAEEQGRPWTSDLPETEVNRAAPRLRAGRRGRLAARQRPGPHARPTPRSTSRLTASDTAAVLVVEDEGPGFPEGPVDRRGLSGGGSTGLGLDIVRRTAERAHGRMSTGSRLGGGAMVQVSLRPARRQRAPLPRRRGRRHVRRRCATRGRGRGSELTGVGVGTRVHTPPARGRTLTGLPAEQSAAIDDTVLPLAVAEIDLDQWPWSRDLRRLLVAVSTRIVGPKTIGSRVQMAVTTAAACIVER